MVRFEVFTEAVDRRRDTVEAVEAVEVATWLDVADVFSVRADDDPAAIGAEKGRQRRPARHIRA